MEHTETGFYAGFARVNITPAIGTPLAGYADPMKRTCKEIIDELEINTVAFRSNGKTAVILSCDLLYIPEPEASIFRKKVAEENGLDYESIFIAGTHTHTAPITSRKYEGFDDNKYLPGYQEFLMNRLSDAARFAIADLKPAKMGCAVGTAPGVAFIRRFRMKDGTVRTNPGLGNPDILHPMGDVDERVNVIRIVREGGKEIAIVNFGNHPCTMRGVHKISADYPRFVRETLEAVMPVHCVFVTGAQGDINHVDVHAEPKIQDDFLKKNDVIDKGYNFHEFLNAKHIGRVIAGGALQVYGDVKWVDVDTVAYGNLDCIVPTQMPDPEDLPRARQIIQWHNEGQDDLYAPDKRMRTTILSEASRMLRLEHGPATRTLTVSAIRVGPAVFVGIPGEPFNGIGLGLKENSPFEFTLPCCLVNGAEGYYPMQECYDEGGYEARSSNFKAGVAERLIETGTELMNRLK